MYGYLHSFLVFSIMICFTTPYGDVYNLPTQRSADPGYASSIQQNANFPSADRRPNLHQTYNINRNVEPVRHTLTSTRVEIPVHENVGSQPTTVRNYVTKDSVTTNSYFNVSNDPDLKNRSSSKRKSQAYEDDSKMLYPPDFDNLENDTIWNQIRSRNCSYGFCDEVDDYPSEKINKIISRSADLKNFFKAETTIFSRFGEGSVGDPLCKSSMTTRFPKTALNMNKIEKLLVNVEKFKQGIVYETCVSNEAPCEFSQDFPQNYVSKCVQKYTVRKLMVVGKESDNPVFDDFKIPSCCVCTVTKVSNGKT